MTGISIRVILEFLPQLFGFRIKYPPNLSTFEQLRFLFGFHKGIHVPSLVCGIFSGVILFGLAALQAYLVTKRGCHRASFIPVIFSTILIISSFSLIITRFKSLDLQFTGSYDTGLSSPLTAGGVLEFCQRNLFDVITISMIAYAEAQRVYSYCVSIDRPVSDSREQLSFGLMNIVGSFFGCFPTTTSLYRVSAFAHEEIRSTLAGGISSAFIFGLFMAVNKVLYYLPRPTTAAVTILLAKDMVDLSCLIRTLRSGRIIDISSCTVVILSSFFLDLPLAVAITFLLNAAIISVHASRPGTSLVQVQARNKKQRQELHGPRDLLDIDSDKVGRLELCILRLEGPLMFYNSTRLGRHFKRLLQEPESFWIPKDQNPDSDDSTPPLVTLIHPPTIQAEDPHDDTINLSEIRTCNAPLRLNEEDDDYLKILVLDCVSLGDVDSTSLCSLRRIFRSRIVSQFELTFVLCRPSSEKQMAFLLRDCSRAKVVCSIDAAKVCLREALESLDPDHFLTENQTTLRVSPEQEPDLMSIMNQSHFAPA